MDKSNRIKAEKLGMPFGTASNRLRKALMFSMAQKLDLHYCFQCGAEIESVDHLSIEHKTPWLNSENPIETFFDLDNIAFSHLTCNIGAAEKNTSAMHKARRDGKGGGRKPVKSIIVKCTYCGRNIKPIKPHHYRDRLKKTRYGITCSHKCANKLYQLKKHPAGWRSWSARETHNLKVASSNLAPATKE